MRVLKTLFWLILFVNSTLADSLTSAQKLGPNELTLIGQPGWSPTINYTYYDEGAAYARLQGVTNILAGTLPVTNVAGTYVLWMRLTSVNGSGGKVYVTLGDSAGIINTILPTGTYRLQVQAKDGYGNTSEIISSPYFYIGNIPTRTVNSTIVDNLIVPE